MKAPFGIAVIGCGTVGNATASLLLSGQKDITDKTGLNLMLKALVDVSFDRARAASLDERLFQSDLSAVLNDPEIKLVVETVGGLTTARTIIEKALKAGKHVVTANKALLAHHGAQLFALAREHNVCIGFEASCAGGIPVIRALTDGLLANHNDAIYGIVNGTSNFILTEMVQKGKTYAQALGQAQEDGLAEADPTLDVNGMDAAHKLTLLASLAFGEFVPLDEIPVEGIDGLNLVDVVNGNELGYVLKLVALGRRTEGGLELAVKPVFLPDTHPLSRVSGAFNAVSVYGDSVGHTMYYGRGAGGSPTASAVVSDILSIALGTWPLLFSQLTMWPDRGQKARLADSGDSVHRYYLRFCTKDVSGVVADMTRLLAEQDISLNAFVQKESHDGGLVPIIITTHKTREQNVCRAVEGITALSSVDSDYTCIRIADEHEERI